VNACDEINTSHCRIDEIDLHGSLQWFLGQENSSLCSTTVWILDLRWW